MTTENIFEALSAPYPVGEIRWRIGATTKDKDKAIALAYIDARAVMDRLDAVVGPANWQDAYEISPFVVTDEEKGVRHERHGVIVVCRLTLKVGGDWVTKADGAGETDVEAEKGAMSDAFKRAAVKFGIGRYLYGLGDTWVALDNSGRRPVIDKKEYARLGKILTDRSKNYGATPITDKPTAPEKTTPYSDSLRRQKALTAFQKKAPPWVNKNSVKEIVLNHTDEAAGYKSFDEIPIEELERLYKTVDCNWWPMEPLSADQYEERAWIIEK